METLPDDAPPRGCATVLTFVIFVVLLFVLSPVFNHFGVPWLAIIIRRHALDHPVDQGSPPLTSVVGEKQPSLGNRILHL